MKKGYLGIDIGSISTKAVLLDEDDNIISSCYLWTEGSPINAVKNVLKELEGYLTVPEEAVKNVKVFDVEELLSFLENSVEKYTPWNCE